MALCRHFTIHIAVTANGTDMGGVALVRAGGLGDHGGVAVVMGVRYVDFELILRLI